jgi:hypothetical protein
MDFFNNFSTLARETHSQKQLFLAMITTMGLVKNQYSAELAHRAITLKDLFKQEPDTY